jgi:6-phosphogluconate dehydrogenase
MDVGCIGLGRMGANMAALLAERGHRVVGFDVRPSSIAASEKEGVVGVESIAALVSALHTPRYILIMVQRNDVDSVLTELLPLLSRGDIVIDGGNSFFKDSIARAQQVHAHGVAYVDMGVSGGTTAAREGACLMVGGSVESFHALHPILSSLARPGGLAHVGSNGAGHFVKMVHNGIEYGMMQALGEGYAALMHADSMLSVDVGQTLSAYANGSIIEGRLMGWLLEGHAADPGLASIAGTVPTGDTETEMRELAAIAPMPVLSVAIAERERSRVEPNDSAKAVAIMRNLFGSHKVQRAREDV